MTAVGTVLSPLLWVWGWNRDPAFLVQGGGVGATAARLVAAGALATGAAVAARRHRRRSGPGPDAVRRQRAESDHEVPL